MPSHIIQLADYVKTTLQSVFATAGLTVDTQRVYDIEFDLGTFTGRKVRVFPVSYDTDDPATRKEDYYDGQLSIIYLERYTSPGSPPVEWIDERVELVETRIFNTFKDVTQPLHLAVYWSESCKVTTVYSNDVLRKHKVFWSEVEITFRRLLS